jgi:aminoglycoside phosphotransferase (APT) family kinase protein
VGFDGTPRFLGLDEQGREILSYIHGEVDAGPHTRLSDRKLISAARLIRRFHDVTAGTPLAGDAEVVCHSDLGDHNMVFQGDEAVGIIDWDEDTAPGLRVFDFSHAVWCLADIGPNGPDLDEQARRVRLVCDAYGWHDIDAVVDEIDARFGRARSWHEKRGFDEGERIFREMVDWMVENGPRLKQTGGDATSYRR